MKNILCIEQKKGRQDYLEGRLTAYVRVTMEPSEIIAANNPISSMIHNGILAVQGNYKDQSSLKDFLQSEFGQSLDEGLDEFIGKLDGLEGALDPQKLKDKLKNLDEFKDFIPTPAKLVPFHNESEILEQDGDIFYLGTFKNSANANLSVSSFAIFYQARYREQEVDQIRDEIDQLITQIETVPPREERKTDAVYPKTKGVSIEETLLGQTIPALLYSKKEDHIFAGEVQKLNEFLKEYQFPEDIARIVSIIQSTDSLQKDHYKLLELYAKKIDSVSRENFDAIDALMREIVAIEQRLESR